MEERIRIMLPLLDEAAIKWQRECLCKKKI